MNNDIAETTQTGRKNITARVREAMRNLQRDHSEYYHSLLRSRSELEGGIGSVYPLKSEHIEREIMSAIWFEFTHPDIMGGCTAAIADIKGKLGITHLDQLPDSATFKLVDPKNTGFCEILLEGAHEREEVGHTVLIIGEDKDSKKDIVFTFHPGDPIKPSTRPGLTHGDTLTKEEAKKLGFIFAKVA